MESIRSGPGTRRLLLGCAAALWIAAGVPGAARTGNDPVLAVVNGEGITRERLLEDFRSRHSGHLSMLVGEERIRAFLDSSIEDRLLIQEARRLELDRDPRVEQATEPLARERRIQALLQEEVIGKAVVPEGAVEEALRRLEHTYRIRWIWVPALADAEAAAARIAAGEEFAAVAMEASRDPSARRGGDFGVLVWGGELLELERQVLRLEPGGVSGAFPEADGFALAMLVEKRRAEPPPSGPEAAERVRGILRRRREDALRQALVDALMGRAGVTVDEESLSLELLRGARQGDGADRVAARVGEAAITLGDLAAVLEFEAHAGDPPDAFRRCARRELEGMIAAMLLDEEARRRGAGGEAVTREIDTARDRAILGLLYSDVVYRGIRPTEAELEKYFDEHREELRGPARYRLQHIVLADRAEAEALRAKLTGKGQEEFAAAARDASLDRASAAAGGEIGWLEGNRISAEMAERLRGMQPGEVSDLVPAPQGFVVFRLVAMEPGVEPSYREARSQVERAWEGAARRSERARWVERLRAGAVIRVDEAAVRKAVRRIEERARARHGAASEAAPAVGGP